MKSVFNYRLKLPAKPNSTHIEQLKAKVNALNLTALRIRKFQIGESKFASCAQISDDTMVLLSRESEVQMTVELVPIDRTTKIHFKPKNLFLESEFTEKH